MRKLISAVFVFLAAGAVHAVGFGDLELDSALNQPLDASVELLAVKPSERSSVKVRMADPESYERFGVSRSPALDDVRIEIVPVPDSDRLEVRLATRRPVREPFLTFLLEADWPGGRALREYTVLLDPPVETPAARAPAPAETAPSPAETAAPERTPRTAEPAPARTRPTRRSPTPAAAPEVRRYGPIARNETLWSIARELRPDSRVGMNQMQLAIYRANPGAFNGNINRLLAGATLVVPDVEEARAIDRAAARREVVEQQREYERYRRRVRNEGTPSSDTASGGEVASAESGKLRLEPPSDSDAAMMDTGAAVDADGGERVAENAAATARTLAESGRQASEDLAETTEVEEPATAGGDEDEEAAVPAETGTDGAAAEESTPKEAGDGGADESSRGVAGETLADASSENAAAKATKAVVPEGSESPLSARNILILGLAILLIASVTFVWLRRRQYKPVSEDFSVGEGVHRAAPAMGPAPSPEEEELPPEEETPSEEAAPAGEEEPSEEETSAEEEEDRFAETETEGDDDEQEEPRKPETAPDLESLSESGPGTGAAEGEEKESPEDMQLDLGSEEGEEERTSSEGPATSEDQSPPTLDVDLSEFDTGGKKEAGDDEAGAAEAETSGGEDEREDEFGDLDLDSLSLDEEAAGEKERQPAVEGSDESGEGRIDKPELEGGEGTSLDLEETAGETAAEESGDSAGESEAAEEPEPAAGGGAETEADEVTTKLDLGRAYLDMGEPEMARSLLQEVKEQGNAEQRQEAEELLERAG